MPEIKYRYNIVPIREWINSEFYLGKEQTTVYAFWKQHIIDYFEHPEKRDLILSGSARAGKTTIAAIIVIRYIYEIGAFESFPTLFNLSATTLPQIMTFSYSKGKASSQLIDRINRILDQSPFFNQKAYKRDPVNSMVRFPWVEVTAASELEHSIGSDMLGAVFDEASLRQGARAEVIKNAQKLFTEIRMRSSSTFSVGGVWGGFSVLIATAGDTSSFAETQIKNAAKPDSHMKVVIAAQYDVEPARFSAEHFKVYWGDDDVRPFIVDEAGDDILMTINSKGYSLEQYLAAHPERIVNPPESHRKFYQEDLIYALQQISGVSISSTENNLFNSGKVIDSIFTDSWKYPSELYIPDLIPFIGIYDALEPSELIDFKLIESHYSGEPVFGHIDLSERYDRTGLALMFYNEDTNQIESAFVSAFYHDRKIPDNEISQDKVLGVIQYLMGEGLNIQYISFDAHGSPGLIQKLRLLYGPQFCGKLSVEDSAPYLELLSLAKRGKIKIYGYPLLKRELSQLVYNRLEGKIDHPHNTTSTPTGQAEYSKDVADALCGATWNVVTHIDVNLEQVDLNNKIDEERRKLGQQDPSYDFYGDLIDQEDGAYKTDKETFADSLTGVSLKSGFNQTPPTELSVRDLLGFL